MREFADAITGCGGIQIGEAWDPAKHPRTGAAPNPGWWAPTGSGSTFSSGDDDPLAPSDGFERVPFRPGAPARLERRPFRSEDDPTPKGGAASNSRGGAGVAIRGRQPAPPFQLVSFSIDVDDEDEAARLQSAMARMGVSVDMRVVDGAARFTLRGKPGEYAWDATGKELERSVLEGMLSSEQDLHYNSLEELQNAVKTLAAAGRFARTGFNFLSGELPKFPAAYFDKNADLRPGVSPAAAVRAIYEHAEDVQMACRNCMQFAVMRALVETYGDKEFDRIVNSYRDPSKPFNILDMDLFEGEDAPLMKWSGATKATDIIPGQWVYALGNRKEGGLSGYEGSNFIVQPGLKYRSPWERGDSASSLGDHLLDAFLYRYRWDDKIRVDGSGRPGWSRWSNSSSNPAERDLIPRDRNAPIPATIRDFLVKTPSDSDETTTIGGLPVREILQPYRGTPRLLENPRPKEKVNR